MNKINNIRNELNNYVSQIPYIGNTLASDIDNSKVKTLTATGLTALLLGGCAGNIRKDTGMIYNLNGNSNEVISRDNLQRQLIGTANMLEHSKKEKFTNGTVSQYAENDLLNQEFLGNVENSMKNEQYKNIGIGAVVDGAKYIFIGKNLFKSSGSNHYNSSPKPTVGGGSGSHGIATAVRGTTGL